MNPVFIAILLMILGKLVFASQDVIIKELSNQFPVHQVMVVRCLVALLVLLLVVTASQGMQALRTPNILRLLTRGVLLFFSFIFFYLGLASLPLTEATVLFFTAPFFIVLLSIPMLGEKVGVRRWTGVLIGFTGVLIVLRPDTQVFGFESLLPVVAAVLYSISQLMARKLSISDSSAVMTFYANVSYLLLGMIMALILLPFESQGANPTLDFLLRPWSTPQGWSLLILLLTGVTGAVGFLLTTQAYRIAEANIVAPFEYVMLIWIAILAYFFLGEVPDAATIIGSITIVCAGLYVLKREDSQTARPLAYKGISRSK